MNPRMGGFAPVRLSRFAAIPRLEGNPDRPAWVPAGTARRQDRLTRLACAVTDRLGLSLDQLAPDTAVVVQTGYGSVESTLRFLDSLRQHGPAGASPTPFTTSVHNATAGTLAELLRIHGPSFTLSNLVLPAISVLRLAARLVAAGKAPAALVICGESHPEWSHRVIDRLQPSPWPACDGAWSAVLEPAAGPGRILEARTEPGRRLRGERVPPRGATRPAIDSAEVPSQLGGWWPGCVLAGLDFTADPAVAIEEWNGATWQVLILGQPCAPT